MHICPYSDINQFRERGYILQIFSLFKGTVSIISSDARCKDDNTRFMPVTLKALSDQEGIIYPNYLQFIKRPHPHSVIILCAWYTIWVSIPIKLIVLSLFLVFITLSDLYYPYHPPSEGCSFPSRKKRHFIHTGVFVPLDC